MTKIQASLEPLRVLAQHPKLSFKLLARLGQTVRGLEYGQRYSHTATRRSADICQSEAPDSTENPLMDLFESRASGRGLWKWTHYCEIYNRHFRRFVGKKINILEVGVYSGGSLQLWRDYFGDRCHIYGVDIERACMIYQNEYTDIFIGDQQDKRFWKSFKEAAPFIDIVIDDGGHTSEQQIITLEEMLPHIRPGGVYVCEDVHGVFKGFNSFAHGLVNNLNAMNHIDPVSGSAGGINPTEFQAWIHSIHFYPYVTVIEKSCSPVQAFISCRKGTEWQPFSIPGAVPATLTPVGGPQDCHDGA